MGIQERKDREKDRRKQQIIVAAKRIFSEKGFEESTMEDIAKEAELSAGTLYLYFKNKHELYASITLRVLQFFNMRLEHINIKKVNSSFEEKMESLKEVLFDAYDFDPIALTNLFLLQSRDILRRLSEKFVLEIKDITKQITDRISIIFKEGIEQGVFIDRYPIALTEIILAVFSGLVLWEESKKTNADDKDYLKPTLQIAFEIFSKGLLKKNHTTK